MAWSIRRAVATLREWRYDDSPVELKQGDEMGRFLLGSTVVMLFPRGAAALQPGMGAGRRGPHGPGDGRLVLRALGCADACQRSADQSSKPIVG